MRRQHDDDLFPNDTSLEIVDIVHFIEHNPFNVSDQICALVEHASKNFRLFIYSASVFKIWTQNKRCASQS